MSAPAHTLLASDIHLDAEAPWAIDAFLAFLEGPARAAAALYLLGDLFEAWVGDDDDDAATMRACEGMAALTCAGVPLYVMHGNRDFLLGEAYAARCGMRLMPEAGVVDIEGRPTLLLHGDTLCTDDVAYQAFRRQTRDPRWQAQMLAQPLAVRRALARQARAESAKHMAGAAPEIMDVNSDAVAAAFAAHGVDRMIHGHTHRPAIHSIALAGRQAERVVLGDWYEHGSVLQVTPSSTGLRSL